MAKGANNSYWGNIVDAISSLWYGLKLTLRHVWEAKESRTPIGVESNNYFDQKEGIVTLQYPKESIPVPDNGRYRLHNEIEDCIVCDKCAKICPVNCIEIEPVRAIDEDLGKTSDGTPKRIHAAKFDIDMGKCCFCGLCTTVCPTECLTMTKAYDFSEFDVADHVYAFAEMTPLEILEKKQKLEAYNQAKAKPEPKSAVSSAGTAKPTFKPRVVPAKPQVAKDNDEKEREAPKDDMAARKPTFKPKVKPVAKPEESSESGEEKPKAKPVFKPKVKPLKPVTKPPTSQETEQKEQPVEKSENIKDQGANTEANSDLQGTSKKPKPVFRPKIKPVIKKEAKDQDKTSAEEDDQKASSSSQDEVSLKEEKGKNTASEKKPRPVFRPKIKPKKKDE